MRYLMLLLVVACTVCCPAHGAANDDVVVKNDFPELLNASINEDASAEQLWPRLLASHFLLDKASRRGHFASYLYKEGTEATFGQPILLRSRLDDHGDLRLRAFQHCRNQFNQMLVNSSSFSIGAHSTWEISKASGWQFVVDESHLVDYADDNSAPEALSGRIHFDLTGFLMGVSKGAVPQLS